MLSFFKLAALSSAEPVARTTAELLFFSVRERGCQSSQRTESKNEGPTFKDYSSVLPAGGGVIPAVHLAGQKEMVGSEHAHDLERRKVQAAAANGGFGVGTVRATGAKTDDRGRREPEMSGG
jgi:hypothetical protein